jgi:CheY-like chemotaxis protein
VNTGEAVVPQKTIILCVDDEENALILRRMVLEKSGFEVLTASSAREAQEVLATRSVDLILSDQLMPGITGTELARTVKTMYPQIPFVLVSGVNEMPEGIELTDLFISKLEGPVILIQKITQLLTGRRALTPRLADC